MWWRRKGPPKIIALAHDDYHAEFVGRTADGRQFFITNPFVPATNESPGREFAALYLFDKRGRLLEARIDDLGPRRDADAEPQSSRQRVLLESLGDVTFRMISIAPFKIERFGVDFGLIAQPPEEPDGDWSVSVQPGDYMCFWWPWNSGDYDT